MKKKIVLVMTLAMVLSSSVVFAEEANDPMAVTLISGPEEEGAEVASLDDVKLGKEIEIDGFGNITFTSFETLDSVYINGYWLGEGNSSGTEADFACLYADILNTNKKDRDYLSDVNVTVIYDEDYVYGGWAYQRDYDYEKEQGDTIFFGQGEDHAFAISPMYTGHYVFGATLPNAVINGKKELKIEINVDGNEMTYYVRR